MPLGWQWVKQGGRDLGLGNGIRAMSEYRNDFGLLHMCVSIYLFIFLKKHFFRLWLKKNPCVHAFSPQCSGRVRYTSHLSGVAKEVKSHKQTLEFSEIQVFQKLDFQWHKNLCGWKSKQHRKGYVCNNIHVHVGETWAFLGYYSDSYSQLIIH